MLQKDRNQAKSLCHSILEGINSSQANDAMHSRLSSDFGKELNKFERLTRELSTRDQAVLQAQGGAAGGDHGYDEEEAAGGYGSADGRPVILSQEQMQRVDLERMRERQAEIFAIQRDVEEIHSMFTDLQTIVEKDGEVLDSIEAHVGVTYEKASAALPDLEAAEDYQRRARRKKCILMLIIVIVLAVIVVGVWQGLS